MIIIAASAIKVKRSSSGNSTQIRPKYVPKSPAPSAEQISALQSFIDNHKRTVILTGAGLSTESGIPDYRSKDVGLYARKNYQPMQYQDFIKSSKLRQRYWARSFVGWPSYSKIQPSNNHHNLHKWEQNNLIHWLITQNVDHLHAKAGNSRLTELHGTLYEVRCLSCEASVPRADYQRCITEFNPHWAVQSFEIATDGDVFLTDEQVKGFQVTDNNNLVSKKGHF